MKISGVDIRPGNIIEYERGIWKVAKIQHTQPGKGGAYMQVEMKNLMTAARPTSASAGPTRSSACASTPRTFSTSITTATCSCSWTRTITSRSPARGPVGEAAAFLQDGMEVKLEM